ncbi:MAG: CoB--CoM heterodisulfide reductase iron-sulfur subunit B family protein [Anaerolineales bacterium]|nr:CoB--CoM heterodisulfide reductase iron-sulfur subunit B family protein [Anaerolineales bacterium]MBS3753396.1 CoB--CoM heterodisulfide reductase iron-sulfur subunit B family protein [Anaerolineales bacterium]
MKYGYYPGCSMEKNARSYHTSLMAIAEHLDLDFEEVEDWNCCGATEYFAINDIPAYALVGRNLAIASKQNGNHKLVAPCSACFLNLKKTDHIMAEHENVNEKVNIALEEGGLSYQPGTVSVHHLLEIIVKDVGLEAIEEKIQRPLYELRIAPYYGCMVPRPADMESFDDPEHPTSMDNLMETLGAIVVDFPLKAQCCGGHMTQISEETALELIRRLLKNADDYGADMISTLCPMCQLNLDAYQDAVNAHFGTDYHIPVMYFTQLIGLAFGIPEKELGFGKEIVSAQPALGKISEEPPQKKKRRRRPRRRTGLPMPTMPEEG